MKNILVFNLGSTSFKFELFDSESFASLKKGAYELKPKTASDLQTEINKIFREALRAVGDTSEIEVIGHRFVHGGDVFQENTLVTTEIIEALEKLNDLAPLHNPYNLAGIKAAMEYLPAIKNYAVFDTAFFKDLPLASKIYPLPWPYYEKFGLKKFGFHGTSHCYAAKKACEELSLDLNQAKLITIHLGGGCSIAAIEKGRPIDTSMGFTPLEGLMMLTRTGDLDPAVVLEILQGFLRSNLSAEQAIIETKKLLNFSSGIKGISGYNDYLELLKAVGFGEPRAKLAFEMFIQRIKKYLGGYLALLGGADAIVFTGKIGAGQPQTRRKICDKMKILEGIEIVVVQPHEELAIAREIQRITI
ncbi:MAG TPA: acetate/propionate family kinase [bacterium]|nr:acetate/propionate family kinase [bacterium]HPL95475.1 acetate/propionate family kinase [bacterium]